MSEIINFQDWISNNNTSNGEFDFGKSYEDLTDLEVRFIINHYKDLLNSMTRTINKMHTEYSALFLEIADKLKKIDDFNGQSTKLHQNLTNNLITANERLDIHSQLIDTLEKMIELK